MLSLSDVALMSCAGRCESRSGFVYTYIYTYVENRFDLLLVMPFGKAKIADENCLSLFDDDKLRLEEVFGDNPSEELLADAADSLSEIETTKTYRKKRPTGKPN